MKETSNNGILRYPELFAKVDRSTQLRDAFDDEEFMDAFLAFKCAMGSRNLQLVGFTFTTALAAVKEADMHLVNRGKLSFVDVLEWIPNPPTQSGEGG